jgi:hypothetical protein
MKPIVDAVGPRESEKRVFKLVSAAINGVSLETAA